eukprot:TRINITY_DN3260_c0_g1_i1.p1 TRINITY_DN3260_c0_g1~~TRINITY_DN3260_c0_g1_i1.p1  ORF type:complete len:380 (-),score=71.26 TRINITY_DN3260_c0_g1_i1:8-1147(-)
MGDSHTLDPYIAAEKFQATKSDNHKQLPHEPGQHSTYFIGGKIKNLKDSSEEIHQEERQPRAIKRKQQYKPLQPRIIYDPAQHIKHHTIITQAAAEQIAAEQAAKSSSQIYYHYGTMRMPLDSSSDMFSFVEEYTDNEADKEKSCEDDPTREHKWFARLVRKSTEGFVNSALMLSASHYLDTDDLYYWVKPYERIRFNFDESADLIKQYEDEMRENYKSSTLEELVVGLDLSSAVPLHHRPFLLLDVRRTDEFDESHIKGAVNIHYVVPFGSTNKVAVRKWHLPQWVTRYTTIVVYCAVGLRSGLMARHLINASYQDVRVLKGGYYKWVNEGKPMYATNGQRAFKVLEEDTPTGLMLRRKYKLTSKQKAEQEKTLLEIK